MTLLQLSAITASLLGMAVVSAGAETAPAPRVAVTKHQARLACRQEASTAVPVLQTERDEMNRLLFYSACVEKRGYPMANRHFHG
jgi:hypothetical protein